MRRVLGVSLACAIGLSGAVLGQEAGIKRCKRSDGIVLARGVAVHGGPEVRSKVRETGVENELQAIRDLFGRAIGDNFLAMQHCVNEEFQ